MRDLLILGAGAHAAEMADIVDRINRAEPTWRLLGFVSAHPAPTAGTLNGHCVLAAAAIEDLPDAALAVENEWPRPLGVSRARPLLRRPMRLLIAARRNSTRAAGELPVRR